MELKGILRFVWLPHI